MAMAMHPDVQAKAQAEIDNTIGARLPRIMDWNSLNYVRCIMKEVLRWCLTLPLGMLPHCLGPFSRVLTTVQLFLTLALKMTRTRDTTFPRVLSCKISLYCLVYQE
jgi:hypothetical protein